MSTEKGSLKLQLFNMFCIGFLIATLFWVLFAAYALYNQKQVHEKEIEYVIELYSKK